MGKVVSVKIWEELELFASAFFSGIFLCAIYLLIVTIRQIVKHRMWAVNLEDASYWIFAFAYLFVQIYNTNNGAIRGYYILGIVGGALSLWKSFHYFVILWKKIVQQRKQKRVDKSK